jgi:hypothetical protein
MTLLSVEEFRDFVTSTVDDEGIQLLLDAAEQAINARFGDLDAGYGTDEIVDGGQSYIFLRRRAASIDSIVERVGTTDTTLDVTDYRLRGDGVSILRLASGVNQRSWWGAPITVSYEPLDDLEERKRVQRALVMFDLNFVPGNATSETIGAWSETFSAANPNYSEGREAIFASFYTVQAPGFA